ncbi:MAG: MFS transporter [Anaerolineae bacterium]
MKQTVSLGRLLALNAYWVGLSFMWNVLHPIVLPAVMLNFVPDARKNTYLGLLTFIGLAIAMVVQPVSGALSDGWVSRFGRRRPLIVLGTAFDFVFLALLAWAGGLPWLFVGYIGLQLSSNIAHGPAQGLLPDVVPAAQIGAASGLKIFMDMFTMAAATLTAGFLLDPQSRNPAPVMGLVMALLFVSLLVTVLGTPEAPAGDPAARRLAWAHLRAQFHVDFRQNAAYWWLIAQRFVCLLGIYGIQQFAQYYIQDVLRPANPVRDTGVLMAAIVVALLIFAVIGGWLTDRFGARRVTLAAVVVIAVGCPLLLLGRDLMGLGMYGAVVGAGMGLFLTANWAQANRLAPPAEAGKYLGLTNLATAGAGALARLEGPAIDALNHLRPGAWWGYTALFLFGTVCALASLPLLRKVR